MPLAKKLYANLEEIAGCLLLVAICVIATVQVVSRYVTKTPPSWTEGLATHLFIWLTFIGSALALKKGEHFAIELLVVKLPRRMFVAMRVLAYLLVIAFCLLLMVYGVRVAKDNFQVTVPALTFSYGVTYLAVPIGAALMMLRSVERLVMLLVHAGKEPATQIKAEETPKRESDT